MENSHKFSLLARIKSFNYAINGFNMLLKYEHNSRIHLFFAVITIITATILKISTIEWEILLLTIGFVISLEIINSTIERLADIISPEWNNEIKLVKDLMAAGVLLSAIISVIIGILIFLPKLITFFT